MKRLLRPLAVILTICLLAGLLAGCQLTNQLEGDELPLPTPTPQPTPAPTPAPVNESLMIAVPELSGRYSPFTAEKSGDHQVVDMTQLRLLTLERGGAVVRNAIAGEVHTWQGTEYRYTGPADIDVSHSWDGTTAVTIRLRDDLHFSDGTPVGIDDLIFTYYVYLDPSYTGPSALNMSSLQGLRDYRTGTPAFLYDQYAAVFDEVYNGGLYGEHTLTDVVKEAIRLAWIDSVQVIVDDCVANNMSFAKAYTGYTPEEIRADEGLRVMFGMFVWNFANFDDAGNLVGAVTGRTWDLQNSFPTLEDFYEECFAAYAGDPVAFWNIEVGEGIDIISAAKNSLVAAWAAEDPNYTGPVRAVSGLTRLDDFSLELSLTSFSEADLYTLCGVSIAPLHYYGDEALYDYEAGSYGFPYGDVSAVLAQNVPMGAGPYRFAEDEELLFKASEHYWRGAPKTASVRFVRVDEGEKLEALEAGDLDLAALSGSAGTFDEIYSMNGGRTLSGRTVEAQRTDYPGYGYIGINADTVNVGGEPGSEESKNLRRALMTIFSVYRVAAVKNYWGDAAAVTDRPVCAASWAAQPGDTLTDLPLGYNTALAGTVLTPTPQAAYAAAAVEAATGYLKAAGYVWDETQARFSEAPEGAKLQYEVYVQGYGAGDHPCYAILTNAAATLAALGIVLQINDVEDSRAILSRMNAGSQEIWAAAWDCGADPDLYGTYHSASIPGHGSNGGRNYFAIDDAGMDALIDAGLREADLEARRHLARQCMTLVYDWACELPVYQRQDLLCTNRARVDLRSLVTDPTPWYSWMQEIEKIRLR